jgi:hypothetical protein
MLQAPFPLNMQVKYIKKHVAKELRNITTEISIWGTRFISSQVSMFPKFTNTALVLSTGTSL